MRRSFILLFILAGCGEEEIQLSPGPHLQQILSDHAHQETKQKNRNQKHSELFSRIDGCGLEHSSPSVSLGLENESSALRIDTQIFTIQSLKNQIDSKNPALGKSEINEKTLILTPDNLLKPGTIPNPAPIVLRAHCFNLQEGESLETEGRDLWIISGKAKINGTIRTTPSTRDDQPGGTAGSIFILSASTEFGPHAFLDARGGSAGKIKLQPNWIVDENHRSEKLNLQETIKKTFVIQTQKRLHDHRAPEPTNEDALLIQNTWAKARISIDQPQLADQIFNSSPFNFLTYLPPPNSLWRPNSEFSFFGADPQDWKKAIASANQSYELIDKNRGNKIRWIIIGKLYAEIDDTEETEILNPIYGALPIYPVDRVAFEGLSGGSGGEIEILSPNIHWDHEPTMKMSSGTSTAGEIVPEWVLPPEQKLDIPLNTFLHQTIYMTFRKDTGDKLFVNNVYIREDYKTVLLNVDYRPSSKPVGLRKHPNERSAPIKAQTATPIIYYKPTDIRAAFAIWPIEKPTDEIQKKIDESLVLADSEASP